MFRWLVVRNRVEGEPDHRFRREALLNIFRRPISMPKYLNGGGDRPFFLGSKEPIEKRNSRAFVV